MITQCAYTFDAPINVLNILQLSLLGRAGGACTSAMLKVLYADHKAPDGDLSFQEVLLSMRDILKESRYTQIPQLSSSRPLDVHSPFEIVPAGSTGTRRAVIIGINYVGQQGELSGCHNDAHNMMEYIKGTMSEDENVMQWYQAHFSLWNNRLCRRAWIQG